MSSYFGHLNMPTCPLARRISLVRTRTVELSWVGFMHFIRRSSITWFSTPRIKGKERGPKSEWVQVMVFAFVQPQISVDALFRGKTLSWHRQSFRFVTISFGVFIPFSSHPMYTVVVVLFFPCVEMQFSTYKHFSVLKNYFGKYFSLFSFPEHNFLFVVIKLLRIQLQEAYLWWWFSN